MDKSTLKPGHLRRIRSLALLSNKQLEIFMDYVELIRCERLKTLFEEGQPGDSMYLILEGRMRVYARKRSKDRFFLRTLEPGQAFGEIALLDQGLRSASVEAAEDGLLLRVTASSLKTLMVEQPALAAQFLYHLSRSIGGNLRDLTKRLRAGSELADVLATL